MRKGKYSFVFSLFLALALTSRLPVQAQEKASPFPQSAAEDAGMSSERLRQAVNAAKDWVHDDKMVGAVMLVIRHDKVVLHEAVGWSDKEKKIPMKVDAIFGMRSMTKPLVGTAILMLLEEGRVPLQDKVSQYLPSFDNPITPAQIAARPYRARSKNITVYQLLTHTSGLTGHFLDLDRPKYASLRKVADDVGRMGPSFKPGTDYEYSNIGSSTLGALIAEISGMPAEEFIQQRILDPLQMKDSFFLISALIIREDRGWQQPIVVSRASGRRLGTIRKSPLFLGGPPHHNYRECPFSRARGDCSPRPWITLNS